jgi:hypothetical protein
MKEELSSSETSVITRATWRNIQEDAIPRSRRLENLESYIPKMGLRPILWVTLQSHLRKFISLSLPPWLVSST